MWCETVLAYTNTILEVDADIVCAETLTQAVCLGFFNPNSTGSVYTQNHSSQQNYSNCSKLDIALRMLGDYA